MKSWEIKGYFKKVLLCNLDTKESSSFVLLFLFFISMDVIPPSCGLVSGLCLLRSFHRNCKIHIWSTRHVHEQIVFITKCLPQKLSLGFRLIWHASPPPPPLLNSVFVFSDPRICLFLVRWFAFVSVFSIFMFRFSNLLMDFFFMLWQDMWFDPVLV